MLKRLPPFAILVGNITAFAGLALLAYLGFYNRYWADDWCYSADARQLGTTQATLQYFNPAGTGYSSNRYSLTFFSALTENTLGMFGNQVFATLTIVFWLIGIAWTLYNISRLTHSVPFGALLFASAFLLFYNLYISPQRFQILYWRSGVLPYSTAIVFWLIILGFITHQMIRATPAKWIPYGIAPLAFLAAGLGEISCVFLFSGASLLLLAAWLARKQDWAKKSFQTIFTAWLFLLFGMIALIVSPSNARIENMGVRRNSLLAIPALSIRHAIDFIFISLRTLPIPHAIFIGTLFSFSIIATKNTSAPPLTFKRVLILLAFATLITFLLVVSIQAPSAYFYSATPDPRGKSLARFTLLAGLGFISWLGGTWTAQKLDKNWLTFASATILLLGLAYTARSFTIIYAELPGFIHRAEIWDERDAIIESAKEQGILLVEVPVIDTADIDTRDMFGSRGKGWTQFSLNCAARYYGVDGLKVQADQQ
ncbi:MAG: hypothetical protein HZB18_06785 [Chloroflexi bacterium]|nr:hypothetical protein [Chloroflexota bacterium]